MKKSHFLSLCLFFISGLACNAQSSKPVGVYIGAELYNTPFNGMQINHIVLYFRNDGKFNDQLDKPDWKTHTSGNYTVKNNTVVLTFQNSADVKQYKLSGNGNLESMSGIKHTLHKVRKITTLPAGIYQSKSASSSGGPGTGMPGVFTSSSGFLYFDGKGSFSLDRSSLTAISGDAAGGTIGGKFDKNAANGGRYKLGDDEITFTYSNGAVKKHSFFYSPPAEEDLVVLDGEFYFREEGAEQAQAKTKEAPTTDGIAETVGLPTPADLLSKLRLQYGGGNIDKISVLKETATMTGGLQAVLLSDVDNGRVRAEIRQGNKLLLIRQIAGDDAWQWSNGSSKPLTAEEKAEMKLNLYQGILGLHQKLSANLLSGKVSESNGDYLLTFFVNSKKLIYLIGSDYALKANAYELNKVPNFSVYKHFTKTNGISYPDVTESSDGKSTITVNTTSVEINPVLSGDSWTKP